MKKNEVKIGGVYVAKVTNKLVQVRIDAENRYGGWDATSLATGKKVRIKSPARLRAAAGEDAFAPTAKKDESDKKAKDEPATQPAETSAPKGEDVANKTPDGLKADKPKQAKSPKELKEKRISGLDAAAQVLRESNEPMTAKAIVETAEANGIWKSPGGKTPHATVYSAIIREIAKKGADSRFREILSIVVYGRFSRRRLGGC